jgi:putative FmdB family regulatory protein
MRSTRVPIYEFYCPACHCVYQFLARAVNVQARPACPVCGRKRLERQVSRFAVVAGGRNDGPEAGGEDDIPFDEERMEAAVEALAGEAESIDEDDPRQAADLMRRFGDLAGLEMGPAMREAIDRMEHGEDPESVEAELGEAMEAEDPFASRSAGGLRGAVRRLQPPAKDETLYEL